MTNPPTPDMQKRYQSLSELELSSEKRYQNLSRTSYQDTIYLNDYQYKIYNVAIHGLSTYPKKELHKLPFQQKKKISIFYTKAQRVLNLWKQEIINERFHQLFTLQFNKFSHNPFNKVFSGTKICNIDRINQLSDPDFIVNITFDKLKITREQIIYKLIAEKVFPENFFQLNKSL